MHRSVCSQSSLPACSSRESYYSSSSSRPLHPPSTTSPVFLTVTDYGHPASSRTRDIAIRPDIIPKGCEVLQENGCRRQDAMRQRQQPKRLKFYDTLNRELTAVSEDCRSMRLSPPLQTERNQLSADRHSESRGMSPNATDPPYRSVLDLKDKEISALKAEVADLQEQLFTERNSAFAAKEEFLLKEKDLKREIKAVMAMLDEERQAKRRAEGLYATQYDRSQHSSQGSDAARLEQRFAELESRLLDQFQAKPPPHPADSQRIPAYATPNSQRDHYRSHSSLSHHPPAY